MMHAFGAVPQGGILVRVNDVQINFSRAGRLDHLKQLPLPADSLHVAAIGLRGEGGGEGRTKSRGSPLTQTLSPKEFFNKIRRL